MVDMGKSPYIWGGTQANHFIARKLEKAEIEAQGGKLSFTYTLTLAHAINRFDQVDAA